MLENAVAKRLKVPPAYRRQAVKVFQHTQLPFDSGPSGFSVGKRVKV